MLSKNFLLYNFLNIIVFGFVHYIRESTIISKIIFSKLKEELENDLLLDSLLSSI